MESQQVPTNCGELLVAMNDTLRKGRETVVMYSATMEPYTERVFRVPQTIDCEKVACAKAWAFFLDDCATRVAVSELKLYWRVKPEFAIVDEGKMARLYMRYLISDAPELQPDAWKREFEARLRGA